MLLFIWYSIWMNLYVMAARCHYRRTANVDRNRLIDAFETGADYLQTADTLGINRSTARTIIGTFLHEGRRDQLPKGGAKNRKIYDDMRTTLERLLDENPLMTMVQMKQQLQARLPHKPTVSTSTIARTLNGMLITRKLAEDVPDQRNAARVLDARRDYANWFLRDGVLGNVVYIDETGYNIWTRRSQRRAPRGEPARRVVHHQRGKQVNITFAISDEVALVNHRISSETVTRETFEDFLASTVYECRRLYPEDEQIYFIYMYDNARLHVRAQLPPDAEHFVIKRLPPYSPFLNPTEMAHSAFKAGVKRVLGLPEWQHRIGDQAAAAQEGVNLQVWRSTCLQEIARNNIGEITHEKCTNLSPSMPGRRTNCHKMNLISDVFSGGFEGKG